VRDIAFVARHFFFRSLFSGRNAVFFVLLVAVLSAGVVSMHSDRSMFQRAYAQGSPIGAFDMPYARQEVTTAHRFVWNAVSYRFLHSASGRGGILLPMRFALQWLAFVIPVVGLALSFDTVSGDIESGLAQSLLTLPLDRRTLGLGRAAGECVAVGVAVVAGLGGVGGLAASLLGIPSSPEQLARMWAMLVGIGLLLVFFFLLGCWISAWARDSGRALWLAAGVFAAALVVTVLFDNAAALRDDVLPKPPAVPADVGVLLQDHRIRGFPTVEALPPSVQSYFDQLEDYSAQLRRIVHRRYQIERWIHAVSPAHLLLEVGQQLLQDEYVDAVDVIFAEKAEAGEPSLAASMVRAAPELGWLVLWIAAVGIGYARQLVKLEV